MKNKYIDKLFREMKKCRKSNDVPVSALIVKNGKIITSAHNTREKKFKTINHAEINAISKANKKLKKCFLYDCDLYVTLKPCEMCEKVINNSRISNVYYLLDKPMEKKEYKKTKYTKINYPQCSKYQEILHAFFNKIR